MKCDYCGKNAEHLLHRCKYCGRSHCSEHILPEEHNCIGINSKPQTFSLNKSPKNNTHFIDTPKNNHSRYVENHNYYKERKPYKKIRLPKLDISFRTILLFICLSGLIFGVVGPIGLLFVAPTGQDMSFVLSNPKPVYFYDISSSCYSEETKITYALDHISKKTNIKFIRVPQPVALIIGGINYDCSGVTTNVDAIGEAESGLAGISIFIVVWNNIRLSSIEPQVVIHETLHTMSLGHSSKKSSIMYPYASSVLLDSESSAFLDKYYSHPFSYLGLIPWNILIALLILLYFVFPED